MRKRFGLFNGWLACLILALVGSGCGGGGSSSGIVPPVEDTTDEAVISDQPVTEASMAAGTLGSVTFEVDDAKTGSIWYPANGQAVQLEMTDASGLVFRLDIPGDALSQPVTITMTALKNIESVTMPGLINGGVRFTPDGLTFVAPATLTVTPPEGSGIGLLIIGNDDGSSLEFAPTEAGNGSVSAPIFHFSSAFATPDDEAILDMLHQQALADAESAKTAANELLQSGVSVPSPPDVKFYCWGASAQEETETKLKEYESAVFSPEGPIVERLLGAAAALELLGDDVKAAELKVLAVKAQYRIVQKTKTLVSTYSPHPDKYAAVARVTIEAERRYSLMTNWDVSPTLNSLASWAATVRDLYIDKLRNDHDYTVIPALMYLVNEATFMGSPDADQALQRVQDAMVFTVYFDTVLTTTTDKTNTWHLNGNVTVEATQGALGGIGDGKYLTFTSTDPDVSMVLPNLFTVAALVENLDACENHTVDVIVDRIGAPNETYIAPDGVGPPDKLAVESSAMAVLTVLGKYDFLNGDYRFTLPVANLDPEAAREVISGSIGAVNLKYDLKLWHSPK